MPSLIDSLDRIGSPHILVVGDLILDRYTFGDAERVCPEAPALVLRAEAWETQLGGAAGVAHLLAGLDAEVSLIGTLSDDEPGQLLRKRLEEISVDHAGILCDPDRPTTTKDRYLCRTRGDRPHQVLRVDQELCRPLSSHQEDLLAANVAVNISQFQAILISDYGKGVCTPRVLESLIAIGAQAGIPVLIDPARNADYRHYRNATLLVPNRAEAEVAAKCKIHTPSDALDAARRLRRDYAANAILIKLDRDGMVFHEAGEPGRHFPVPARSVFDVAGAGDMVLAMLGLCRATGLPWDEAVQLANCAAGLEVERQGVAVVTRAELRNELLHAEAGNGEQPITCEQMGQLAEAYRCKGLTVVMTNGCFDLFHAGHLASLQAAARLGDILVVAINSDQSVRRLKGKERPVIPQEDRAALIAALRCVDHVVIFDEDTPHRLLWRIRPDVLVKGWVPVGGEVVGREVVEEYGGKVCVTGKTQGISTTDIIASLRGSELHAG